MEPSELLLSKDGSHTIYSEKYNAHYHSIYGAIEESLHVFISAGLYNQYRRGLRSITIFEMGLGTGLNAYLSLLTANKLKIKVNYITVETDPITVSQADILNYSEEINEKSLETFTTLHSSAWAEKIELSPYFTFEKHKISIQDYDFKQSVDVIYYDAFAPSCQPELWEADIHTRLYDALNPYGTLVTYCAKGSFKRMLKSLGYKLEMLNGPNKKREMTRAVKI